jgi:two-component system, cell cycle sensor histidine kinase PleC
MLFVMLLVVAISSMLASGLPTAVFAATFPVTTAVALDFILQGKLRDYVLAFMALTAQGYFAALTYRLYSSTLATLQARRRSPTKRVGVPRPPTSPSRDSLPR